MGQVLRTPLHKPNLAEARTVVPESKVAIEGILPTEHRLYIRDIAGGPSQVRVFDTEGRRQGLVPVKPVSTVAQAWRLRGDAILLKAVSYLEPGAWLRFGTCCVSMSHP